MVNSLTVNRDKMENLTSIYVFLLIGVPEYLISSNGKWAGILIGRLIQQLSCVS